MRLLTLPSSFPFLSMVRDIADNDTMYVGSDEHYLAVGLSALRCIVAALAGRQPHRILDMPSGFGRITRLLRAQYPKAAITVCDLDRAGVDFAALHFNARPAYSVEDFTTLSLGETYDLIWVGSLVTHLSESQTQAFLAAMARHMRPGSILVLSAHGPTIIGGLHDWGYGLEPCAVAELLDNYRDTGYGHRGYGAGNGYGISMSDELWWREATVEGPFRLVSYSPKAWDDHQDIAVLRRSVSMPYLLAKLKRQIHGRPQSEKVAATIREHASCYDDSLRLFDTAFYLDANPDVALAVAKGHYVSAFQHYWRKGRYENRRPNALTISGHDSSSA